MEVTRIQTSSYRRQHFKTSEEIKISAFKCGRESPTSLIVSNHDEVSYKAY
jgi:hypothetical protein